METVLRYVELIVKSSAAAQDIRDGPNIDGAFEAAYYTEQLKVRAAFHRGMDLNGHALSGTDRSSISMEFNAADSNPIYSPECDTVQPKSLRALCLIRAYQ